MDLARLIEKQRFLGREFLVFLWFESELFDGQIPVEGFGPCELRLESWITLSCDKEQARLKGVMPSAEPEAHQARPSEHDRVVLTAVDLAQTRIDVAAHGDQDQVRARALQRHLATQAARPHARAGRKRGERQVLGGDEHVTRILAQRDAHEREPRRDDAGHVLDRVHGIVGAPLEQSLLDLLHEEPFAPHLRERAVLDPIPARDDLLFDELEIGTLPAESGTEGAALGEREG